MNPAKFVATVLFTALYMSSIWGTLIYGTVGKDSGWYLAFVLQSIVLIGITFIWMMVTWNKDN